MDGYRRGASSQRRDARNFEIYRDIRKRGSESHQVEWYSEAARQKFSALI